MPDPQRPHGLQPTRLLCPWIFQASVLERIAISFSRGLPDPGIEPWSPALQADSLTTELPGSLIPIYPITKKPLGCFQVWVLLLLLSRFSYV